ncbi:hypothetical protein TNCV_1661041 [Trichonephila clavipes]|nr:hypothetical protein TNCV_1661041 [Trichonephila clavipes]
MLEHPSDVSLSISWDLCQGLCLVISTYLLSWTTSRNGPKCTPFGSGIPHRSGGCSAALDIEIWGTSSTSFRSGKKFRLCGIEGGLFLLRLQDQDHTFAPTRTASAVPETTDIHYIPDAFGRDLRLPCDLLFGRPPDTPSSPEEYVQNLQARFERCTQFWLEERINLRDGEDEDSVRHKSHRTSIQEADDEVRVREYQRRPIRGLLMTILVILNQGQLTRIPPELAAPSNFHIPPTGGRFSSDSLM